MLYAIQIYFIIFSPRDKEAGVVFSEVLSLDPTDGTAALHLGFVLKTTEEDMERSIELLR